MNDRNPFNKLEEVESVLFSIESPPEEYRKMVKEAEKQDKTSRLQLTANTLY